VINGRKHKRSFFGQAQKVDLSYGKATGLPFKDKQDEHDFISGILQDVLKPEELESLKKDGVPFGLWARYRNTYRWQLTLAHGAVLSKYDIRMKFLNGESYSEHIPFSKEVIDNPRPLPQRIAFFTTFPNQNNNDIVYLDELELMAAFEKLGAYGELVNIEFSPRKPREATSLRVHNDKETIELKKTIIFDR
jgi:hypothetical protein